MFNVFTKSQVKHFFQSGTCLVMLLALSNVYATGASASENNTLPDKESLMGPEEFAEPETRVKRFFGPVIAGQSLWRVARRIHNAFDISIEQMMWNLYKMNPQAFINNDINALKTGSILTIPNKEELVSLTDSSIYDTSQTNSVITTTTTTNQDTEESQIAMTHAVGKTMPLADVEIGKTEIVSDLKEPNSTIQQLQIATSSLAGYTSKDQTKILTDIQTELKHISNRLDYMEYQRLKEKFDINQSLKNNKSVTESGKPQVISTPKTAEQVTDNDITTNDITTSTTSAESKNPTSLTKPEPMLKTSTLDSSNGDYNAVTIALISLISAIAGATLVLLGQSLINRNHSIVLDKPVQKNSQTNTNTVKPSPVRYKTKTKKSNKKLPKAKIDLELSEEFSDWVEEEADYGMINYNSQENSHDKTSSSKPAAKKESLKALQNMSDDFISNLVLQKYWTGKDSISNPNTVTSSTSTANDEQTEETTVSHSSFLEIKHDIDAELSIDPEIHIDEHTDNEASFVTFEESEVTNLEILEDGMHTSVFDSYQVDLEFEEEFLLSELSIPSEEIHLVDLIQSLGKNEEFKTAHDILDNCRDTYGKEHIDFCRLYLFFYENDLEKFHTLFERMEEYFEDINPKLINDIYALKESIDDKHGTILDYYI